MKKILLFIIILSGVNLYAQQQVSYNMLLPQRDNNNPANTLNCNTITLPGFYIGLTSSSLRYSYLYSQDDAGKYYLDFKKIYDNLEDKNFLFTDFNVDVLGIGWWIGNYYLTINQRIKTNMNIVYPKGMVQILAQGNYDGNTNTVSFDGLGANMTMYNETSIGLATEVIPNLTVGVKIKFLKGIANLNTKNFSYTLTVDDNDTLNYPITFKGYYEIQASNGVAQFNPVYDTTGTIQGIDVLDANGNEFNPENLNSSSIKSALLPNNGGVGVDIGINYKPIRNLNIWASVTDLGYIKWRSNAITLHSPDTSFTFSGIDILNSEEATDEIVNSLIQMSNPEVSTDAYITYLNTKLNFGANYDILDWINAGILYQGMFFKGKLYNYYSVNTTFNFWRGTSLALGYTNSPGGASNIGLGMSFKMGIFQWYFIADNMAPAFFGLGSVTATDYTQETFGTKLMKNAQMMKIQFGMNLMFGCKDRRDLPLLQE